MPSFTIFAVFATLAAAIAVAKVGGLPERSVALTIAYWILIDQLSHLIFGSPNFQETNIVQLLLDGSVFIILFVTMLKANRNWPILATASQLIAIFGHLSTIVFPNGMQRAYWAMTQLPPLLVLICLAFGTLFHRIRLQRLGPYRHWSY
ncbi:MAG: hypothetical protein WA908_09425 [Pontixanthobacter sp.]